MTKLTLLIFILALLITVRQPNSIAEHTSENDSCWEEYLKSPIRNRTKITSLVNEDNTTINTTSSYREDQKNESVVGIENTKVIILPTTNLTNSSSGFDRNTIDKKITLVSIDKFIPEQNVIEKCSLNDNYCIKVDNYPREDLLNLFKTSKFMSTNYYYDTDAENEVDEFEPRISDSLLQSFCQARTETIYPEVGLTIKNEWRYIIQDPSEDKDSFKQGIRVEKCIDVDIPCAFDETLPLGYTSTCVQKYIYKRLMTIKGSQEFYYDSFKLPSCCKCMYSINADLLTRIGGD
ncbi:uncharacterized protein LOC113559983 [Rhopalosiphum maidis]|uniref:uncharacterized protein LOC113559983 n=1 Tax=Rhopalosiphum maidis TaxID=43146 RepID=UPI000F006526|nr:uncharacterized protein LOC113559983 [Rhopalosiphum maidis]